MSAVVETLTGASSGPRIQVLSEAVVNQISAGEVIDRPASVVRELVDNAIDAGATEIAIEIEEGGRRLIRVTDNGYGLCREDLLLAFQNHATSKVRTEKDLNCITTFGFRGEALASIAAVARVEMRSRVDDATVGYQIRVEAGKIVGVEPSTRGKGTDITVRNIFFNTPARRKFLKTGTTEEAKVKSWVIQSSIPNPNVSYKLIVDGKCTLSIPKAKNFIDRAREFISGSISEFSHQHHDILVSGLIGHPGAATSKSTNLLILVNRRVVKDSLIVKAVREGFSSMLKGPEVPVGVVSIELPISLVDINVHPQKSEVRFVSSGEVFVAVRDAIIAAVNSMHAPINLSPNFEAQSYRIQEPAPNFYSHDDIQPLRPVVGNQLPSMFSFNNQVTPSRQENPNISFKYSDLKFIGQIFKCYLLCEYEDEFVVIDMHAAHERINYNKIRTQFRKRAISEQRLVTPVIVPLTIEGHSRIKEISSGLVAWGFDVELFGENDVVVRSAPSFINITEIRSLIISLSEEPVNSLLGKSVDQEIDRIAAKIACHGSIRSGKLMQREEAYSLLSQMDEAELSGACPHGRPVAVKFSSTDIEKWFGRDR